jgi:hypothetical protein
LIHHHDGVGHFEGFFLVVGDENAGDVKVVVESAEPASKFLADPGVQSAKGFIEEENLGFDGERSGKGDPLALAAGELRGKPVRHAF